jgi:hypothetical protein
MSRLAIFGALMFGLAASAHAQSASVTLAWDLPTSTTGITEYHAYLRASNGSYGSTFTRATGATATSVVISGIAPGSYFFMVKSFNGSVESAASNETAVTALVTSLEGLTSTQLNGRSINVKAFNAGQTTALLNSDLTANSSGMIAIPTGAGLPSTFDLKLDSTGYLIKKIASRTLTDTSALPALFAGDLDESGIINTFDYNIVKTNWLTSNTTADINRDGVVNSFDYSYLKKNWFLGNE